MLRVAGETLSKAHPEFRSREQLSPLVEKIRGRVCDLEYLNDYNHLKKLGINTSITELFHVANGDMKPEDFYGVNLWRTDERLTSLERELTWKLEA